MHIIKENYIRFTSNLIFLIPPYYLEPRRHQLVKQDSVISFADQRRGLLMKQDSIIAYPNRNGSEGHHVSILKKTNSQSSSENSPRRNIEFAE